MEAPNLWAWIHSLYQSCLPTDKQLINHHALITTSKRRQTLPPSLNRHRKELCDECIGEKKSSTLQPVDWPKAHSCWELPSEDGLSDRRKGTKASFGVAGMLQRASGRTELIYTVSIGPHWFFSLKPTAFFLLFSQPSYAFAVQSHGWLMQMVCSLQETLSVPYPACGCSVPLFLAPFPLERWLFPSALPRVVVLGHKPAAHPAVLTSCFLLTRRCCERHRTGSTHQPFIPAAFSLHPGLRYSVIADCQTAVTLHPQHGCISLTRFDTPVLVNQSVIEGEK